MQMKWWDIELAGIKTEENNIFLKKKKGKEIKAEKMGMAGCETLAGGGRSVGLSDNIRDGACFSWVNFLYFKSVTTTCSSCRELWLHNTDDDGLALY